MSLPGGTGAGAILTALPDDGRLLVRPDGAGRPVPARENCCDLPEETGRWLAGAATPVWAARAAAAPPPGGDADAAGWSVNLLADADTYARGLAWHDARLAPGARVFNHPRAVALTRRDLSAARLADVPGLQVPACRRFVPRDAAGFAAAFEAGGFRFPVLVRPCGQQGGTGLLRIDSAAGWAAAADTSWLGAPHFMTQFVEAASADGLFRKARVLFVAGRVFVRHVKLSREWQVHNRAPGRLSDDEELPLIDRLRDCPVFSALAEAVAARLMLDHCGMDLGVDPESRRYVLFEANPAMAVFFPDRPGMTGDQLARRARLQAPPVRALDHLLRSPSQWVSARQPEALAALPSVAESLGG